MKKILSLGAAAAVLSLTAVAASAAITPVVDGNAVAGEEVVVTVVANGLETPYATFTLEVENLEQVGEAVVNPIGLFNPANGMFTFAAATAPADGTELLTITYVVTGEAGDDISVTLKPVEGEVDATPAVVTIVEAEGENPDEPGEPTDPEDPTIDPEDPEAPTVTEEPTEPEEPTDPDNAETGVALAVIPALVAGAAVVASKKRS